MRADGVLLGALLFAWASDARAAGALESVAQDAAKAIAGRAAPASLVVAGPLITDEPTARGDDLAIRLAALVASRLGPSARTHPHPAQLGTARALAGRSAGLVYVQSEIARGSLRATLDVFPPVPNAWDRIGRPLPASAGHGFGTAKLDAEVRSFLLPLLLEQASVHRFRHEEGDVLAAACGDVDEDGGDDLVLVSSTRVAIGRVRDGKFVADRTAAWTSLASRAPVPMRIPLAGAVVTAGAVDVGSTDRSALALTPDFASQTPLSGVPAWGGTEPVCLLAEPSAGAFDGAPFDCVVSRDPKAKMAVPAPRFDAFAAAHFADVTGGTHDLVAVHEPSGKLKLRMDDQPTYAAEGLYGAQLAAGDLDQDGAPEIVSSTTGNEDAVVVYTLASPAGELRQRLHIAAPAGVRALAICPPEQGGRPVLVAVVGSEIWLVRAQLPDSSREP